jgi:hypothetical protein
MYMQRTTSGAASNGLYTTIKCMRGAAGIGLGTTHHDQAPATHNERHRGKRPGRNGEVPATHKTSAAADNGLSTEHHDHPPL